MLRYSIRRLLAGLAVAAAVVTAAGTPTSAAPASDFELYANDVLVAPGGAPQPLTVRFSVEEPSLHATVTVDQSGVKGARVSKPIGDHCTQAGEILTCTLWNYPGDTGRTYMLDLTVMADGTGEIGQAGELEFTATTSNGLTSTYRSKVTLGEAVNLAADQELRLRAEPGDTLAPNLTVTNVGDKPVHGFVMEVNPQYALAPQRRYENCEYQPDDLESPFVCFFDDVLQPGTALRVPDDFALKVRADVWAPDEYHGTVHWMTPDEWQNQRQVLGPLGQKGTQGVLKLEPAAIAARAKQHPQADTDPYNSWTRLELIVTGGQRADVAAVGATLNATVGTTVPMTVGYINNGPAVISNGGDRTPYASATATIPKGTTVVKAATNCWRPPGSGNAGAAIYHCGGDGRRHAGESATYTFQLRIDTPGHLVGRVDMMLSRDADPVKVEDLNPANDTAEILVNGTTGGQGGGENGAADDGEGSLPITGTSTGLIAGLGGLLLVAGLVGFLLARRRRTNFVA
ncbi:LPXTG cell wall anchor domain-containing protein [Micromonospora sp. NPDC048909]|uniref:LPXTG cell wall anchor domain-containing protein n=1 Tax=Micromonospora sp. NPDC048909 TaxID=3155643 RepID=UPI0033E220FE